jgi:uncharacterized protein (TIGR02271 family)
MARRKKDNKDLTEAEVTRPIPRVQAQRGATDDDRLVVPLVEEQLLVNKEWVEAGAAQIRKQVETTRQTIPVELAHEEVHVERVAVNRELPGGEAPAPRQEGDTLVIPVVEEEVVVMKRLILREEVRVTKRRVSRQEEVSDVVRREHINIEGIGNVQSIDR